MPLRNLCWVLTPGEAGMRSQALGLAEAVGLPIEEKRVAIRAPFAWLPGGLLPICSSCKRIRENQNNWLPIETYLANKFDATLTHGICPECSDKFSAEMEKQP